MTLTRLITLMKNSIKHESKDVQRAAQKEFLGILGMSGVLAGAYGLPFSSLLWGIADLLMGDDDEPVDSKLLFYTTLKEKFGETVAKAIAYGPTSLSGTILSGRIGLDNIGSIESLPPEGVHGRSAVGYSLERAMGPAYSIIAGWAQAADDISKGEYQRGLENALPKPLKDGLKAYRFASEGVKTKAGKRLVAKEDLTADEIVMMALGFTPDEAFIASEREYQVRQLGVQISERHSKLVKDIVDAYEAGEDATEALDAYRTFAKKMPGFANPAAIRSTFMKRAKGDMGVETVKEMLLKEKYAP